MLERKHSNGIGTDHKEWQQQQEEEAGQQVQLVGGEHRAKERQSQVHVLGLDGGSDDLVEEFGVKNAKMPKRPVVSARPRREEAGPTSCRFEAPPSARRGIWPAVGEKGFSGGKVPFNLLSSLPVRTSAVAQSRTPCPVRSCGHPGNGPANPSSSVEPPASTAVFWPRPRDVATCCGLRARLCGGHGRRHSAGPGACSGGRSGSGPATGLFTNGI
jgi:hypothetical protein